MKQSDFRHLHLHLSIKLPKTCVINPLPSDTDPTQDIPIRNVELSISGDPINVKKVNLSMSNVCVDSLTAIDRRHNDKFDVVGEYQKAVGTIAANKQIKTNFKSSKNSKKDEK